MYDLKDSIKAAVMLAGLGYEYHDIWWRLRVRRYDPLDRWTRQHRAIFIHIPKTAGMSLYECFGMEQPAIHHIPIAGFAAFAKSFCDRAFKFTVVRNPWDRLVSAFHYMQHVTKGGDDRTWAERYLSRFDTFDAFLAALEDPVFRALVKTWRYFLPQWYFICDRSGRPLVDEIVRFEDLERGTRGVSERLGIPFMLTRKNDSPRKPYQEYYSAAGRELVRQMYRKDVEVFGYAL
jgi:hypothetical protein